MWPPQVGPISTMYLCLILLLLLLLYYPKSNIVAVLYCDGMPVSVWIT